MTWWHVVLLGSWLTKAEFLLECLSWVNTRTGCDIWWSSLLWGFVQIYNYCGQERNTLWFVTKYSGRKLFQGPCICKPSPVSSRPSTPKCRLYTKSRKKNKKQQKKKTMCVVVIQRKSGVCKTRYFACLLVSQMFQWQLCSCRHVPIVLVRKYDWGLF